MFGLRLQQHSFNFFVEQLGVLHSEQETTVERLNAVFGLTKFIHLTRMDKVAQAVSYVKAQQTGLWHMAPDGTELERLGPPQKPSYDADGIGVHFEQMKVYDAAWLRWFEREQIDPLRITYETLSADPVAVLRTTLDYLNLDTDTATSASPAVSKLADDTSQQWAMRFRLEHTSTVPSH